MAGFSILSDTSAALLGLLRTHLCPDPIPSAQSIALVAPNDKNADFQLGLYLYDLKELSEYRNTTPVHTPEGLRTRPPKPLSLYYMLFLNHKAQIAAGAEIEQRVFAKTIQTLYDNGSLSLREQNPYLHPDEEEVPISLLNHSFEDKTKIWSALQSPYQVGVYFTASPVLLSSQMHERITRVTGGEIRTEAIAPGVSIEERAFRPRE